MITEIKSHTIKKYATTKINYNIELNKNTSMDIEEAINTMFDMTRR